MARGESSPSTRDRLGSDALGLLAEALFERLDEMVRERLEALGPPDAEPEEGWLKVSEVAERIGACATQDKPPDHPRR